MCAESCKSLLGFLPRGFSQGFEVGNSVEACWSVEAYLFVESELGCAREMGCARDRVRERREIGCARVTNGVRE